MINYNKPIIYNNNITISGQKFAMLEMKILISSMLRRFRLEAVTKPADLKFKTDILLRTVNESILVKFYNRF